VPLRESRVNIVSSNDVDDSKVVEDVRVPSEISSVVEKSLINSGASLIDESHVSSADISDVGATVESSTPIPDDIIVLEDEPSKSIALHLLITYNEIPRQIAICNDDYKFAAFSRSILQEFAVVNKVTGMIHSEIEKTLHN